MANLSCGVEKRAKFSVPAISSTELASHASEGDLWIAIHGNVYDVSTWLSSHPGGDIPLLSLAGQDVTDAFLAFHPSRAFDLLPRFLVASLHDYHVSAVASDFRLANSDLKKSGIFRKSLIPHLKTAFISLALLLFCFTGVCLFDGFWLHFCCAISLGFVWTHAGWIGHDVGHNALFGNPKIDRYVELLVGNCMTGVSISWWKRNHNAHHLSCNSLQYDPDLQYIPLFAVSSKLFSSLYSFFYERKMDFNGLSRLLVSYQHWTFYPVMALARINLFAQTFILLLSKKKIRGRRAEILGIAIFWIWFVTLLACLPNATERVSFILVSFAVTGIQHVQFCLNHFSSPVYDDRPNSKAWVQAQVKGTLNITCPPWMDWFHGGLQFQIEHHLFPRLPRFNLRKASGLVKALCKKHDICYTSVSFWEANVMIFQTLRDAAFEARDLSKPVPKNLVWEAVNSPG